MSHRRRWWLPTAVFASICAACLLPRSAPAGSLPIWDPPAIDVYPDHRAVVVGKNSLEDFIAAGRRLFLARFTPLDGGGRPAATGDSKPTLRDPAHALAFQRLAGPDANSCAGCHNQPAIGGSGDFAANVFVGAHFTDPPTARLTAEVTNERNTISIFGAGAIEMAAREMTDTLRSQRQEARIRAAALGQDVRASLAAKGVSFGSVVAHPDGTFDTDGIRGVDIDLVVKPFGVKGVAVSLREFTNFALNQHHGIQSEERFGWARTGVHDFDGDGVENEFTLGQVSALTVFQAALPAPGRVIAQDHQQAEQISEGERRFSDIGCASCHRPRLPLDTWWFFEPNPYNRPGSAVPADVGGQIAVPLRVADGTGLFRGQDGGVYIAAYTDLMRHVICDAADPFFCNERIRQDFVPTDQFLTAKLWDAGTSAPYGHRGDLTTLSEAIIHHSGEAAEAKQAFLALPDSDKRSVIQFLRSLQVTDFDVSPTQWR
jgi:hypothetical protein